MTKCRSVLGVGILLACGTFATKACAADEPEVSTAPKPIDATTLRHKVMCGYQGWFRAPNDGTDDGWLHWSRNRTKLTADTVTVEMWPDTLEYTREEKYPVPGFTNPDKSQAYLFSSAHPKTVLRHFRWMQQYGIDGVFVQRFLVNTGRKSFDQVLAHVRSSAASTERVYAVCYDLTDAPPDKLYDLLVKDWQRLVDELKVTNDKQYLHHNGKPVLFVWGFFSDRFSAAIAHRIIDFFKTDKNYAVTLIGGCQWQWRPERDVEWAKAFRRFDVISPWNVGNYAKIEDRKYAATGSWKDDLAESKKSGMAYLPVIYPGFGWTNLKGKDAASASIPRLGGEFYWRQFVNAAELDIDMAYVAMFDEVDEATAIFKVSNNPPTQAEFTTLEGLPTDWYLRLTAEGSKVIRGERKGQMALPIKP